MKSKKCKGFPSASITKIRTYFRATTNNNFLKMLTIASWKHTLMVITLALIGLHSTICILMLQENFVILLRILIKISPLFNNNNNNNNNNIIITFKVQCNSARLDSPNGRT
jgi:hypothetical protein